MKYYLTDNDGNEYQFDVFLSEHLNDSSLIFNVLQYQNATGNMTNAHAKEGSASELQHGLKSHQYFVRTVASKRFISSDGATWSRIPTLKKLDHLVNKNKLFKVSRGFLPSGMNQSEAGALRTDMPGKVVKVLISEGAVVKKGDTLLILEAMKMENEIKAGIDGIISKVYVGVGEALEAGCLMIEIDDEKA